MGECRKSALAFVMERYGIEWKHKGTHEKHLSVLDYKKQERATELEQLGAEIEEKQTEFNVLSERVLNYDDGLENLKNVEEMLDTAPEYQLSEPQGFMTAKAYKTKIAEPLIQKLKALVKTALARCFEGWDNYHRLNITNGNLYRDNEMLSKINSKLKAKTKICVQRSRITSFCVKFSGINRLMSCLNRQEISKVVSVKTHAQDK